MPLPEPIGLLIAELHKLPGIGPRSAERIALHLAQTDSAAVKQLADTIVHAREKNPILHDLRRVDREIALFHLRRRPARRIARVRGRARGGHFKHRKIRHVSRQVSRSRRDNLAAGRRRTGRPAHCRAGKTVKQEPIKENRHRAGHGRGGRCNEPLPRQTAHAQRG